VTAAQAPLSGEDAALVGLAVLTAVVLPATWALVRYLIVMAHEGAHAVVTLLLGRGVPRITLNSQAEGATQPARGGGSPGTVVQTFAGYVGPSAFGLGAAMLISSGYIVATLWVAVFLLGILLIAVRWSFGIFTVILAGGLVFALAYVAPVRAQVVAAYAIAWMLLLAGVRRIFEIGLGSADGKALRATTGIPHLIWSALWLAGALAAAVFGARMLITGP
jgi:hypothetical protein